MERNPTEDSIRELRQKDDPGTIRAKGVALAFVGVLMLVGGWTTLDAVECGRNGRSAVFIEPGETCETTTFWLREEVTRSYAEQKRIDDLKSYGLSAFGVILVAAGVGMVMRPEPVER